MPQMNCRLPSRPFPYFPKGFPPSPTVAVESEKAASILFRSCATYTANKKKEEKRPGQHFLMPTCFALGMADAAVPKSHSPVEETEGEDGRLGIRRAQFPR